MQNTEAKATLNAIDGAYAGKVEVAKRHMTQSMENGYTRHQAICLAVKATGADYTTLSRDA